MSLAFLLSHAVIPSLPTSFLKPIHSQYLLNFDLSPLHAGSFLVIAGLTRPVLKRTRRQPWRKMSLLCVSLQARLLWRGPCLVDLDKDRSVEDGTF